jgi:hypothetical protein
MAAEKKVSCPMNLPSDEKKPPTSHGTGEERNQPEPTAAAPPCQGAIRMEIFNPKKHTQKGALNYEEL